MKTMGIKWMVCAVVSVCSLTVMAQNDLTVKVTNVRSANGKVLIATDKGQYNMVDVKGKDAVLELKGVPDGKCKLYVYHDENGNYQLDKEDDVPVENCAIVDLDVKADGEKTILVELVDVREKMKSKSGHGNGN